ncbi:MAG: lysylphosphatidylglycerol synthase transmembrane domain-containing protein, partial [Anaerolineae bacterium]
AMCAIDRAVVYWIGFTVFCARYDGEMSADKAKQKRNRILSWAINLAGVLAFVFILYLGGVEAWEQIIEGDWRYVLAALAVTLLWNLVAAFRWSLIADQVAGAKVCAFRYYFTYQMIGMLTGQVVPITVGMIGARPVALSLSQQLSLRRSALSVFLDKSFDLILALLLVTPVALFLIGWIELPLACWLIGGVVVAGLVLIGWQYEQAIRLFGRLGARFARSLVIVPVIGRRLVSRLPQQLDRLSSETFLENRVALQAFLLTMVMYVLLSARLFFIAQALRLEIPWYLLAMGVAVTQLALVFSVTPGSLGFLEGGWGAVLGLAGLTLDQFTTFVIGRRAFVLVFTLIGSLLAFAWIRESPARLFRAVLDASRQPRKNKAQLDETAPAAQEPGEAEPVALDGQAQLGGQVDPE